MPDLILLVLRPLLIGLAAAAPLAVLLWWRGGSRELQGSIRITATVALSIPILASAALSAVDVVILFGAQFPDWYSELFQNTRRNIVAPLVLGIIGAVVLLIAPQRASSQGRADLTRRTALSFIRPAWLIPALIALVLTLIATAFAGVVSSPDDDGNYTTHVLDTGAMSVGGGIYGWYFSIPALILLAILPAILVLGLQRISRPPLDAGSDPAAPARDAAIRRQRALCLIAIVTGALLLHLGSIFMDLANTAMMSGRFSTNQGSVAVWSTFAALQAPLRAAGNIVAPLAYFVWFSALLPLLLPRRSE